LKRRKRMDDEIAAAREEVALANAKTAAEAKK
jgi:hypothetical protein